LYKNVWQSRERKHWRCVTMEINEISELMMFSLPNNTMKKDKIKNSLLRKT
jgi:hypothetical protein